jgi:diguanylate cyclase (GGDEF)-like protein
MGIAARRRARLRKGGRDRGGRRAAQSEKLLGFLAGLATDLATVLDLPVLLRYIIRAVHDTLGFESCALALLEERDGEQVLVVKAGSGLRARASGMRFGKGQGLIWEVLEKQTPVLIPDLHAEPRELRKDPGVRSGVYAPLVSRGHSVGVLSLYRAEPNAFTESDLHLLTVVARYIASSVEVSHLHDALRTLAMTDSLTGIANRRQFMERLRREIRRVERTDRPLSVVLLDLDRFKAVNDTHGHGAGDAYLIAVARALSGGLRKTDLPARFGGDEFALLLHADADDAAAVVSRFRNVAIPGPGGETAGIRFSWGAATWPQDGRSADELLQTADVRMYRMKEQSGSAGPQA